MQSDFIALLLRLLTIENGLNLFVFVILPRSFRFPFYGLNKNKFLLR